MNKMLTIILAGGKGQRLHPISREKAKPALPFGGKFCIIDFVLSNFINSGFYQMKVLTQYRSESLSQHIAHTYNVSSILDHYIETVPPQMKTGEGWYKSDSDAVYQNIDLILDNPYDNVSIFCADQIYKMDISQMLHYHDQKKSDVTLVVKPIPINLAKNFNIVEINHEWKITGFKEKPQVAKPIPGMEDMALAFMGNYIFKADVLVKNLIKESLDDSKNSFAKKIIPGMINKYDLYAYNFNENRIPGEPKQKKVFWANISDIDSYWRANMDLVSASPYFDLYNENWPIRNFSRQLPPAKITLTTDENNQYIGGIANSLISEGCVINNSHVERCVISPMVKIKSSSHISQSVLMTGVSVGENTMIKGAIINRNVKIPPDTRIGFDLKEDKERFYVSPYGIVVVDRNANFESRQSDDFLLDNCFLPNTKLDIINNTRKDKQKTRIDKNLP